MAVRRSSPLELAVAVAIPLTVLLFTFGSSSVPELLRIGSKARWAALLALAALALVRVAAYRRLRARIPAGWVAAAVLLVLCADSALWSVDPRATVGRVFTLGVLFAAAVALMLGAPDARAAASRVLDCVLAGGVLVAVGGLVVLVVRHHDAVQSATLGAGWRFQGLGESPNTVPMLLAVGLPIATWRALEGSRGRRLAGLALVLLFSGEIAVSGSRGALAAGFAGAIAAALAAGRSWRARLVPAAALVLLAAAAIGASRLPAPLTAAQAAARPAPHVVDLPNDAKALYPLEGEFGFPHGVYQPPARRSLFGSSGRAQAWAGAWDQAVERPVAGYGYGTESTVFADRFYAFESSFVENSYLGLFLQIGALGVLLFVGLLAMLAWNGVAAVRRAPHGGAGPAAGALGALVAAAVIGLSQSGLLTTGNVAASSIWLTVLTLPALAAQGRRG